jgi:hypothetical protein
LILTLISTEAYGYSAEAVKIAKTSETTGEMTLQRTNEKDLEEVSAGATTRAGIILTEDIAIGRTEASNKF